MLSALAATKAQSRRSRRIAVSPRRGRLVLGLVLTRGAEWRAAQFQTGIHRRPRIPVATKAMRHPLRTAIQVARGGARMAPRLTPAWLTALPSARSGGRRYAWMALPADGMPAASASPSAARQP